MQNRPLRQLLLSAPCLLLATAVAAQGNLELGKMWTFENPPLAYLEEEYGFAPSAEWLDALRLASLRYGNGCSASFVSPKGLIMTNHHCARDDIAKATPQDRDWVKNGFYAGQLEDEVRLEGLTVQQLVGMHDITDRMNAGIDDGDDDDTVARKRRANEQAVLAMARAENQDLQPQVVKLHQGAVFQLYLYRVWDDIRLVCSPHLQTGHFGGDPDNFTYPRYSLDFSFVRAYEDGEPADTSAHYFRWSTVGPQEGDLVFVTGNPGTTDRLKTKAQMDHMRDAYYPIVRQLIDNRLDIMRDLAAESSEQEQRLRTNILMFENAQKAYAGYHEALLDDDLMARKVAAEAEFKRKVMSDPELRAEYGSVWDRLEEVAIVRSGFEARRRFQSPGGSKHLARALAIVQAVKSGSPEASKMAVESDTTMSDDERAFFVDHLERAEQWLPADDPYLVAILGDDTPEDAAALLEESAVASTDFVKQVLQSSESELVAIDDPAMMMALALEPLVRANEKLNAWLTTQETTQGALLGRAMFACYGNSVSPDATFTLRFSDGVVDGFPYNGTIAPFRTSFYGLYARHAEFDGQHPFDLPKAWIDRRGQIDMTKSVNFVSSNDIIGGNSGSPIVNQNLEVVGLIFDGNIEMLANKFLYTDEVPRAVSVHVHGIIEALTKVYDADRVVAELIGR